MPWHWGRGIFYNQGACPDCDVGTTVDRVMGLTTIYGHQLAAAWDLGAQGPTTQQLSLGRNDPSGYPYDLSQNDDVLAVHGVDHAHRQPGDAARARRPRRHRRQLRRCRSSTATRATSCCPGRHRRRRADRPGRSRRRPTSCRTPRRTARISVTPDVWFKLQYKALTIEFEGIGVFGRIERPGNLAANDQKADAVPARLGGGQRAAPVSRFASSSGWRRAAPPATRPSSPAST